MIKNLFNNFLKNAMIGILVFSFISSILINLGLNLAVNIEYPISMKFVINIFFILITLFSIVRVYCKRERIVKYFFKLLDIKNIIVYIILISFIIRILWIVLIETSPVSDFAMMYDCSKDVFYGNFSCFHDFNYFARFTHNTISVLYYSLFYIFNENPIFIVKLFNVIFSTLSIFIMYSIVKQLYGYKSALVSAILLSVFPPFIMYNSQMLSENMAMPFYLISIYFFTKYMKSVDKHSFIIFSGLALSVGNLFRMVGMVFLIAYIMYFLIYKGIKNSVKPVSIVIAMFILPMYITSSLLLNNGITESHLWKPKETFLTSVLRGTNLNSFGFWNEEDAKIPSEYNYDEIKVKETSIKIIKQRLFDYSISNIVILCVSKLGGELGASDFGAFGFTVLNSNDTMSVKILKYLQFAISTLINIIHLFLLYFGYVYFKRIKNLPNEVNLLLILLGGFVLLYLISEVQPRYSFIIYWVLVIFAVGGLKTKFYESIYSKCSFDNRNYVEISNHSTYGKENIVQI